MGRKKAERGNPITKRPRAVVLLSVTLPLLAVVIFE